MNEKITVRKDTDRLPSQQPKRQERQRKNTINRNEKKEVDSFELYTQLLQEYNENISDEDEGYDNNIATGNSMRGTPNSYKELRKQLQ